MRILIAASGSYGDVYPFLALGRELKGRGHDVRFFASARFTALAEEEGLTAVSIGTVEDYESVIRHPDAFHPKKGVRIIARTNMALLPEAYRALDEHVVEGGTIAVGSTLALATRVLQEARRVPTATVHLAPSVFRSAVKPPRFGERPFPQFLPPWLTRALFLAVDHLVVDPIFCTDYNRFRATLGLPPMRRMFGDWLHRADVVVGLFPEWFAERQPDWPRNLWLTGFPLFDGANGSAMPSDVEEFLEAGDPPVVFTAGTAAANERAFFAESVGACRRAGCRGLLLTRYEQQLPQSLPEGVRHFAFVPFSRLLPRARALVHHGGIGTSSQALAAGIPQLVRPLAYDQFDNAARLESLGVSRTLSPRSYRAPAVASALDALASASTSEACHAVGSKLEPRDAIPSACDVILRELG